MEEAIVFGMHSLVSWDVALGISENIFDSVEGGKFADLICSAQPSLKVGFEAYPTFVAIDNSLQPFRPLNGVVLQCGP